jgi:hypothetical protein
VARHHIPDKRFDQVGASLVFQHLDSGREASHTKPAYDKPSDSRIAHSFEGVYTGESKNTITDPLWTRHELLFADTNAFPVILHVPLVHMENVFSPSPAAVSNASANVLRA